MACYVSYLPLQIVSFQIPQAGGIYFHRLLWSKIGIPAKDEKNPTSLGVTIAYPVWAPISLLMPFFSSVVNVSHRRTLQMKKCLLRKMFGPSKNLGIDPFPNSVGHFETQWRPSWISHVSNTGFAPRIQQLSYRGGANLKIMIFVFDILVIMVIDLGNCKNQTGWFQS